MKINANYITGLVQSDGNFSITIQRKNKYIWLSPKFNITLHKRNKNVIEDIKNYLGVGHYIVDNRGYCRYNVNKIEDLINVIIPFFLEGTVSKLNNKNSLENNERITLKGNKFISFIMFKIIVVKLYNKEHYNKQLNKNSTKFNNILGPAEEGGPRYNNVLLNLINMAYNINMNPLGKHKLSRKELLNYFNNSEKSIILSDLIYKDLLDNELSLYNDNNNINIDYIKGLFDGDGNICLYLEYNRLGNLRIRMTFNIVQDLYNKKVLEEVKDYFNCGYLNLQGNMIRYDVKNIKDLNEKILPKLNNSKYDNNTVRLYKLIYVQKVIDWIYKNNISTIKTLDDLKYILSNMYYIHNNKNNITLDKYIELNVLKYKLKKDNIKI